MPHSSCFIKEAYQMQKANISAHVVVNMSSLVVLRPTPYSFISSNDLITL